MANKNKIKYKNNLQKYRVWKNMTQKQLSEMCNVSQPMIYKIEKENYLPNYIIRQKICKFFNVTQKQMFTELIE
jgi:DNA-binding XRE family transcriptional regulator